MYLAANGTECAKNTLLLARYLCQVSESEKKCDMSKSLRKT
jgi:hypothetical protein